jgi:benzaldehyde dehydrogenase (NAD)
MTQFLDPKIWEGRVFDGAWTPAPTTKAIREPATGDDLGRAGYGDPQTVARVGTAAAEAQQGWRDTAPEIRAKVMRDAARLLEAHAAEIIEWDVRETGAVPPKAQFEVLTLALCELHEAASLPTQPIGQILPSPEADRLNLARRIPIGVVGVISPWNFPLILSMRSVAPALALGNAVILKPDPQTPVTGGIVIARLFEEAGLPRGLLSVLPGGADVGEAIVTDRSVRMVTFTGSTAVGRRVGELAGKHLKRVVLELGGNNVMIILDDADIALASSAGAWGSFLHQGQICMSTGRHIVHERVAEQYLAALAARANALPVGDPFRSQVALGPLINKTQLDRVHRIVTESVAAGASLAAGGTYEGPFYKATVLGGVTQTMPAFKDEIFGPVAPVIIARDDDEAVALANASDYGLSAAVRTGSLDRGLAIARRIRSGMIHINDQTVNNLAYAPFGGVGHSGNGSRFGSTLSADEFTEWQWITAGSRQTGYPF